jgi:hypothetical protein
MDGVLGSSARMLRRDQWSGVFAAEAAVDVLSVNC